MKLRGLKTEQRTDEALKLFAPEAIATKKPVHVTYKSWTKTRSNNKLHKAPECPSNDTKNLISQGWEPFKRHDLLT